MGCSHCNPNHPVTGNKLGPTHPSNYEYFCHRCGWLLGIVNLNFREPMVHNACPNRRCENFGKQNPKRDANLPTHPDPNQPANPDQPKG
jgi:hypothetical protein